MKTVIGPFRVTMHSEPPYSERDGVVLARARVDKRFDGGLDATGEVQMLAVTTPDPKSRAYVALERISGMLDGREGSFVVTHVASMTPSPSLAIAIVPGTGTGALAGIVGAMRIRIEPGGDHFYELDYAL